MDDNIPELLVLLRAFVWVLSFALVFYLIRANKGDYLKTRLASGIAVVFASLFSVFVGSVHSYYKSKAYFPANWDQIGEWSVKAQYFDINKSSKCGAPFEYMTGIHLYCSDTAVFNKQEGFTSVFRFEDGRELQVENERFFSASKYSPILEVGDDTIQVSRFSEFMEGRGLVSNADLMAYSLSLDPGEVVWHKFLLGGESTMTEPNDYALYKLKSVFLNELWDGESKILWINNGEFNSAVFRGKKETSVIAFDESDSQYILRFRGFESDEVLNVVRELRAWRGECD
jgi:hypothetical protein